ncbi:hypothetical protein FRC01_000258 [Tulasnella sp. 417]|nr:hypothetical protein FRC01_000258 [Tulasnella sp. 417]
MPLTTLIRSTVPDESAELAHPDHHPRPSSQPPFRTPPPPSTVSDRLYGKPLRPPSPFHSSQPARQNAIATFGGAFDGIRSTVPDESAELAHPDHHPRPSSQPPFRTPPPPSTVSDRLYGKQLQPPPVHSPQPAHENATATFGSALDGFRSNVPNSGSWLAPTVTSAYHPNLPSERHRHVRRYRGEPQRPPPAAHSFQPSVQTPSQSSAIFWTLIDRSWTLPRPPHLPPIDDGVDIGPRHRHPPYDPSIHPPSPGQDATATLRAILPSFRQDATATATFGDIDRPGHLHHRTPSARSNHRPKNYRQLRRCFGKYWIKPHLDTATATASSQPPVKTPSTPSATADGRLHATQDALDTIDRTSTLRHDHRIVRTTGDGADVWIDRPGHRHGRHAIHSFQPPATTPPPTSAMLWKVSDRPHSDTATATTSSNPHPPGGRNAIAEGGSTVPDTATATTPYDRPKPPSKRHRPLRQLPTATSTPLNRPPHFPIDPPEVAYVSGLDAAFVETKIATDFRMASNYPATVIHGIPACGLDLPNTTHVINCDLPSIDLAHCAVSRSSLHLSFGGFINEIYYIDALNFTQGPPRMSTLALPTKTLGETCKPIRSTVLNSVNASTSHDPRSPFETAFLGCYTAPSSRYLPLRAHAQTLWAVLVVPTTFSLAGGDRFSRALTLVGDAPVPSASEPKAAGATEAAASGTDEEDLRLSIADFAQLPGANLPYRDSLAPTAAGSAQNLSEKAVSDGAPAAVSPTPDLGPQSDEEDPSKKKRKKLFLILGGVAALAVIAVAVAVPVVLTQTKKSSSSGSSSSSSGNHGSGSNDGPTSNGPKGAITGGDGSIITTEKGTTFTYINKFGGTWYDDPDDAFNNNAQAQSWTPPLTQEWNYNDDPMRGVNLGGWLVPEPFIMEKHYDTFITEEDFAQIAGAGLNWIRLPIPFWMVAKLPEEPYLERVSWKYCLKAFKWARKYGLRIQLDLHSAPGSQNGFDHSGKGGVGGEVNWLVGPMGLANAQRTLDVIRVITEFVSQPKFLPVVPMFGIINEAMAITIAGDSVISFWSEAHDMIHGITGTGAGMKAPRCLHEMVPLRSRLIETINSEETIATRQHVGEREKEPLTWNGSTLNPFPPSATFHTPNPTDGTPSALEHLITASRILREVPGREPLGCSSRRAQLDEPNVTHVINDDLPAIDSLAPPPRPPHSFSPRSKRHRYLDDGPGMLGTAAKCSPRDHSSMSQARSGMLANSRLTVLNSTVAATSIPKSSRTVQQPAVDLVGSHAP